MAKPRQQQAMGQQGFVHPRLPVNALLSGQTDTSTVDAKMQAARLFVACSSLLSAANACTSSRAAPHVEAEFALTVSQQRTSSVAVSWCLLQVFEAAIASSEVVNKRALARKVIIERRKEEQERILLEAEREQEEQRLIQARVVEEAELKRRQQEQCVLSSKTWHAENFPRLLGYPLPCGIAVLFCPCCEVDGILQ